MNKTVEYIFEKGLDEKKLILSISLIQRRTCLNFVESRDSPAFNGTLFKRGKKCMATADLAGKYVTYSIHLNNTCMERDMILKLIYLNTQLRYEFAKCLGKHQGNITDNNMPDVMRTYNCFFYNDLKDYMKFDLDPKTVYAFPKKYSLTNNIEPKTLEQRNYAAELSFTDLKGLDGKICKDECKKYSPVTCKNSGFRNSAKCDSCVCPFFYNGRKCEKLVKPKKSHYCGSQYKTAKRNTNTQVLDINAECYYKIKPYYKKRKVQVKFTPIGGPIRWPCNSSKILEVKYEKDKSKDGVMPCGQMKEFTVKSDKGVSVLVYHDKIGTNFKIKMQYKAF
uniref:Metalloendopeptidase n=1 Tax=Strongyloides papillosus TaxID=174720 RepID=A0A0N5BZ68_STREA